MSIQGHLSPAILLVFAQIVLNMYTVYICTYVRKNVHCCFLRRQIPFDFQVGWAVCLISTIVPKAATRRCRPNSFMQKRLAPTSGYRTNSEKNPFSLLHIRTLLASFIHHRSWSLCTAFLWSEHRNSLVHWTLAHWTLAHCSSLLRSAHC